MNEENLDSSGDFQCYFLSPILFTSVNVSRRILRLPRTRRS
jgi:hypothetical protein